MPFCSLSSSINQVVIFCSKVDRAVELDRLLNLCNFPSLVIHSRLKQEERYAFFAVVPSTASLVLASIFPVNLVWRLGCCLCFGSPDPIYDADFVIFFICDPNGFVFIPSMNGPRDP